MISSLGFGGETTIIADHRERLLNAFLEAPQRNREVQPLVHGRAPICRASLNGCGDVVVKHYRRGGLLGRIISNWYLRSAKPRSQLEFEVLLKVRSLGISAPEPLVYAFSKGLLYRAWLVTREIRNSRNLVEIALTDSRELARLMPAVCEQVCKLIENGIYHTDLHPGNVLVDSGGKPYILDFDNAKEFKGRKNQLRDAYLCRWRRAALKHKLPEDLAELLAVGVRRNFED